MKAAVLAGALAPIHAQEVTTAVDDRVETGVVEVPEVSEESLRHGGLDIEAIVGVAYDDNIFLSQTSPESDMVLRAGVAAAYQRGDATDGEGAFVQVAYRPTAVVYAKTESANRIDQEAALLAGWRGKASKVSYAGAVRSLGDATADTGRQTDRLETANELRAAWLPREKIAVEVAVGHRRTEYDDATLFDSSRTYGEIAVRYAYSPKTEVGLAFQAGELKVDDADDQTTRQLAADINWQPREKIRVNLLAGAEHRDTANGSDINPVLEGRIDWTPRQGTGLYVSGYVREEASAFLAGQNYSARGVVAGVSQRLGGSWTARLDGGYETAGYSLVAGTGTSGRRDKIWFVRPSLEYKITDALDVSLFYRISENRSTAREFGYDQNMAGIELRYQF